jgi:hypothetical protein
LKIERNAKYNETCPQTDRLNKWRIPNEIYRLSTKYIGKTGRIFCTRMKSRWKQSISIKMDVCVCMFEHNSGTLGAISAKLGTHIAICMCKNLICVLYIFRREVGVGGREFA